jgi:hypothetical protein
MPLPNAPLPAGDFILYQTEDGGTRLEVKLENNTVWLSLLQIAELFQRDKSVISKHIKNVYDQHELTPEATVARFATVQKEGDRDVGLDAIMPRGAGGSVFWFEEDGVEGDGEVESAGLDLGWDGVSEDVGGSDVGGSPGAGKRKIGGGFAFEFVAAFPDDEEGAAGAAIHLEEENGGSFGKRDLFDLADSGEGSGHALEGIGGGITFLDGTVFIFDQADLAIHESHHVIAIEAKIV